MDLSREQILALHREHMENGVSLDELGQRFGVSYETIRRVFIDNDLPRRAPGNPRWEDEAALRARVEERRPAIIATYKRVGTIPDTLKEFDLPRRYVVQVINSIEHREIWRRRGTRRVYTHEELIADVQTAAQHSGQPLSIAGYRAASRELGLASFDTVVDRFAKINGEPWQAALKAAGVKGHPARGKYGGISQDQCVDAVVQFLRSDSAPSKTYEGYCRWVPPSLPSGANVRKQVGWNRAVSLALDRL